MQYTREIALEENGMIFLRTQARTARALRDLFLLTSGGGGGGGGDCFLMGK